MVTNVYTPHGGKWGGGISWKRLQLYAIIAIFGAAAVVFSSTNIYGTVGKVVHTIRSTNEARPRDLPLSLQIMELKEADRAFSRYVAANKVAYDAYRTKDADIDQKLHCLVSPPLTDDQLGDCVSAHLKARLDYLAEDAQAKAAFVQQGLAIAKQFHPDG